MNASEVARQLAGLREAGTALRRRRFDDTLEALCRVLDGWADPSSAWREELVATLPAATRLSEATVREGLRVAFEHWNGEALRALVRDELGGAAEGFATTAVLLAGSIPMPTLLSMLAPLVLRSPVLAKSASRDPVTAPLVARSIAEVDAELGACVAVADFARGQEAATLALLQADCVVATGSDDTMTEIAERMPGDGERRLVRHGHRLSVATLGPEATRGDALVAAAEGLALDVALWDQLGCLSPVGVYVVDEDPGAADRVAEALATALAEAQRRWPRGRLEPWESASFVMERNEAQMRAASDPRMTVHVAPASRFSVVREGDAKPRRSPLHRFVRVMPVAGSQELLTALWPLARHLAGVALAGFGADQAGLEASILRMGASRVCAPGALQAPPLDWRNDGHGVLASLVRE